MREVNVLEKKDKTRARITSAALTFGGIMLLTFPPSVFRWNGKVGLPIIQEYLQGGMTEHCSSVPIAAERIQDEFCFPVPNKEELKRISPSIARTIRVLSSLSSILFFGVAARRWHVELKEIEFDTVEQLARDDIYSAIVQAQVRDVTGNFIQEAAEQEVKMLVPNVKTFDPRLLKDHVDFPHIRVLGGTRAGKTHTTGKILNWLPGAKIIIAPKVNPKKSDWQQCRAIVRDSHDKQTLNRQKILVGKNQQFHTIANALDYYAQIDGAYLLVGAEHDYTAITQALDWALATMSKRQSQYTDWNPIEIILDDATITCQKINRFGSKMKELLLLAGDVDLRIWALVHMSSMKALRLEEGNAELLENFKTIYIGKFAHKEINRLINKSSDGEEARYYQARKEVMRSLERHVLVIDQPLDSNVLDVPPNLLKGEPEQIQNIYQSEGADSPYKWVNKPEEEDSYEVQEPELQVDTEEPERSPEELEESPDNSDIPQHIEPVATPTTPPGSSLGDEIEVFCAIYKLEPETVSKALQRMIWETKINPENKKFKKLKKEILWNLLNIRGRKYQVKGEEMWQELIRIVNSIPQ